MPQERTVTTEIQRWMRKLAGSSGKLPHYLILRGLKKQGQYPLFSEGFAEVYYGEKDKLPVALKVLRRLNNPEDAARARRVRSNNQSFTCVESTRHSLGRNAARRL